ncbi:MAG: D-alanyl-D-alanine carboxypeptidase [Ruminococcaceae bacterium]|nr:D-alanyl-D-alanine carboxypeptidase [Oscillospiraceae bacterium]
MNQNMTPNRPPQRSAGNTQGQQQRPPQQQPPKKNAKYSTAFFSVLIGTVALLVISIVVLCVVLAVGGFEKKPASEPSQNDGGAQQVVQQQQQTQPNTNEPKAPTAKFLTLPSATAAGNYASSSAAGAQTMATDTTIQSAAAILVDMSGKTSIGEKNADTRVYPASMTKVMTLLLACEKADSATDMLTVTDQMLTDLTATGGASTLGGWMAGDTITVEDALFLVNYKSDTIACWLLANYISGSESAFAAEMTARAKALGCNQTNFVNSTGLHSDDHYTTCRDMATIMQAAMSNTAAKTVLTAFKGYTVSIYRDGKINRTQEMYCSWFSVRLKDNKWAGGGSDMAFIAGKTGNETIPSSCFVTAAENTENGKQYICVTVGRIDDTQTRVSDSASTADAKYIYKTYAEGSTQ